MYEITIIFFVKQNVVIKYNFYLLVDWMKLATTDLNFANDGS